MLIITTKQLKDTINNEDQNNAVKPYTESKILFLIDGKEVSRYKIESIDPNDIESITVIKDKEAIKSYTNQLYDGVVLIFMKKE